MQHRRENSANSGESIESTPVHETQKVKEFHRSPKRASTQKKPKQGTMTPAQKRIAGQIVRNFSTPGRGKSEIFPGANRYVAEGRLQTFETAWHPGRPMQDAVNFAMLVVRSVGETFMELFAGNHVGLKKAIGGDAVRDILAYVNSQHPFIKKKMADRVIEKEFLRVFSRHLYHTRSVQKKKQGEEDQESTREGSDV